MGVAVCYSCIQHYSEYLKIKNIANTTITSQD